MIPLSRHGPGPVSYTHLDVYKRQHVGFVTGYPVSHGCVRLPADMAKTFFEHTPLGTKVTIR